jgi:tRNA G18 (ribose-2'-O)-methylase SpoU
VDLARTSRRLVITEATVDPTNIGAIARSAAGLGFDGLVLSPTCADPLYRRSVKVSMGEVLRLPTARARTWPDPVGDLVDAGWHVLALTPAADATDLRDVRLDDDDRVALLLGTEGEGLSAGALAAATQRVSIPMRAGVDSLNVAVAAGVACWALAPRNPR